MLYCHVRWQHSVWAAKAGVRLYPLCYPTNQGLALCPGSPIFCFFLCDRSVLCGERVLVIAALRCDRLLTCMQEVEIKFRIADLPSLKRALRAAGFRVVTRRTHEMNTLYDLPGSRLRKRGESLRMRLYGERWTITFKGKARVGRHKSRLEIETQVADGVAMESILKAAQLQPNFRYEKFRTELSDGRGHVVIDETPIGTFGEIEGPPRWIDSVARQLQVRSSDYITDSYPHLFLKWKQRTGSPARNLLFADIGKNQKRATKNKISRE